MSSFNAPQLNLPRYVEGDIYGFVGLLNNDPENNIDDNHPVHPHWNDGKDSNGGLTAGHITRSNTRGQLVGIGAVGRNADQIGEDKLTSPFEVQDIMDEKNPLLINNTNCVLQPTIYEYTWYDPIDNEVKNSNNWTFSSAFHECYYISINGKLRTLGTRYSTKPAIQNAFDNLPPILSLGYDWRMTELWEENPDSNFYNPDISLKHICVASNECIMTLDTNGTIRIIHSGTSGVTLNDLQESTDYWQIVYWDKEDLEDNFWIDENGNTVVIDNVDFVDCWCSGGGTPSQGICVWALKRDGTLYYQDIHSMVWLDMDYWKRDDFNGGIRNGKVVGDTVQATVRERGKYRSEPRFIQKLSPPDEEEDNPSVPGTWVPKGPLVENPYHSAAIKTGGAGAVPGANPDRVRDLNDYASTRQTRRGSHQLHYANIEEYFNYRTTGENDPIYGEGSLIRGWGWEAGRNALQQIPQNANGKRFKVISLFDGYGHGGGCLTVDPDEPIGDPSIHPHPDQKVEPVLLNTWVPNIHKHMYEQLHKVKRYRVVSDGLLGWRTEDNFDIFLPEGDDFGYQFDSDLFDMIYKDSVTGTYTPPRRLSSARRIFTIMSNNGMIAAFQGGGGENNSGDILNSSTIAPLVNYEIDPENESQIRLKLDENGKHTNEEHGNWFYNYDWNPDDSFGDPAIVPDNDLAAYFRGAISEWDVQFTVDRPTPPEADSSPDPTHGPHNIGNAGQSDNGGRFGFGNMPPRGDGTTPGLYDKPFTDLSGIVGRPAWAIHYFAWTDYVGYDYENYYWNQDSLVYLWSGYDITGETIHTDTKFKKGSSCIYVWHAGPGSTVEPFASNPVVWWASQGDNINAVFENGVVDSCSYYESEMSAAVMPPLSLPVALPTTEPPEEPEPQDPDPPLGSETLINITQDTEIEPGTSEDTEINPETPECQRDKGGPGGTEEEEEEPEVGQPL